MTPPRLRTTRTSACNPARRHRDQDRRERVDTTDDDGTARDTSMSSRTGWSQQLGGGIRRDHRIACPATRAQQSGTRCDCPYSFWTPTINGHRRRARVFGTLADARRAKRQAEQQARAFRRTRTNQQAGIVAMPTLDEWYRQVLEREWQRVRPGTRDRRHVDYTYRLAPALGKKRLDQLTTPTVQAWLDDLLRTDGNRRCVQAAHETLTALLAYAVVHRLLPDNPAKHVLYPAERMRRRTPHALDHDEYRHLLAACRNVAEHAFVRVLCEAGLRRSEVIALRIGDLQLDDGLIHIQRRAYRCSDGTTDIDTPKSRKARYAAINDSLVAELRQVIAGRENAADAPVWTRCNRYTEGRVEPLTGAAAYKLLKRIARHARLEVPEDGRSVSPHVMRATGASLAVAAGVPEQIASRQLGHARVDTTRKHYLRLPVVEPLRQIGAVFE